MFNKINTIVNHVNYYHCKLSRPAANRLFSSIGDNSSNIKYKGKILCEALWDHPHHWLRLAIFRHALAPIYGSDLIGIYEEGISGSVLDSLRSLPISEEIKLSRTIPEIHFRKAKMLLNDVSEASDLLDLKIAEGYPAHYFYDGILKSEMLGTLDVKDKKIEKYLAQTLFYIDQYLSIFKKYKLNAVVVSHPTTIRFSTLVWAAISNNIPVFVLNYRNHHITIRKLLDLNEIGYMSEDMPTILDRDRLTDSQRCQLISLGQNYLKKLYEGKGGEITVTNAFSEKGNDVTKKEFLKLIDADHNKKNIVILTSCWPDFPNALGRSYFTDHIEWLNMTLKIAQNNNKYNWIFKSHPAELMYGKRVTLESIIGNKLGGHIFMWPNSVTGSLVNTVADCVVTALGSVGFEYPALGKRSLVARETGYTKWGFSNYANDYNEYESMLNNAPYLPLPTEQMKENALIYMALRLTTPNSNYKFPLGRLSYKLWPELPDFIRNNKKNFSKEISIMRSWLRSDSNSYNVFKGVHPELWT